MPNGSQESRSEMKGYQALGRFESLGLSRPILVMWVGLAIVPLFTSDEYLVRLFTISLLFGAQAMIFDFSSGLIGIVNFGVAGFLGLGAYTSALLNIRLGISPWLGFLAAALVAGAIGLATGVLTLRLRGLYAACMTWFVAMTLKAIAAAAVSITRGYVGLPVPYLLNTAKTLPYYYILLAITAGTYVVLQGIARSHVGLAFKAIGQNLDAAQAAGIDPVRYKVLNFTVACVFLGLVGGFYAHFVGILTPEVMATSSTSEVLALSYIGGRGTIWGGLAAAFILVPLMEYLRSLMAIRLVIYGLLMILVMLMWPGGIALIPQAIHELVGRIRSKKPRPANDR